ncbi:MAG: metallophosphoesterase family protein, partial [Bacilli bacterium]|nr:metallophosphoesterase family protein [Bacilli bacterium]
LISDTHLGRTGDIKRERLDLIDNCFDFCKQNGIHIIIHGGDFIDGLMDPRYDFENPIKAQAEQIDYAINHYPYDKDILTFLVIGNHDYDAYARCGQNLAIALNDRRHDIVPFGIGCGKMRVKNDSFLVTHRLMNGENPRLLRDPHILRFNGHTHRMRFRLRSGTLIIDIPALVEFDNAPQDLHSALKVRLDFEKGYFKTVLVEQYLVDYRFQKISEGMFDLNKNLKVKSDYVALEEPMIKARIL